MHMNVEIEFKTRITKEKYDELIDIFELDQNVFKQTNYYFDTPDLDLNKRSMVLRIRHKRDAFKLTLKSQSETGSFEYHVLIDAEQAEKMKKDGFHTKEFFEQIDYHVYFQASLDNFRASTPYMGGILFLDYNEYCGKTDYELEYEADHFETGLEIFNKMLHKFNIEFEQTKRKSERALLCIVPTL